MAADALVLDGVGLTLEDIVAVARYRRPVRIAEQAGQRLAEARSLVFAVAARGDPVYGLNRGVGWNKDKVVDAAFFETYNRNLILSHSAGVQPYATAEEVRAVLLARLNGLLAGRTGVQPAVALRYAEFLNLGIHPRLPLRGSVGAADITNLPHIGLALIGEGEVEAGGTVKPAPAALAEAGLAPLVLGPRDGLAIVSSNALSAGLGALALQEAASAVSLAETAYALSLEALPGQTSPLDEAAHRLRPYPGQLESLRYARSLVEGGGLWRREAPEKLQDPLSFRAACQIHGAARDALRYTRDQLLLHLNSSDDNPALLWDEERFVANAHFEPVVWTLGFEMLGQALHHVSRCSSLRTIKLGTPAFTGLSRFLTPDEARSIGFCTLQKTATSLDTEIRHLSNPASGDYASLAGDIEDHAANAPFVVSKTREIADRLLYVVAIELMHAAQAVDLRGSPKLGRGTEAAYRAIREAVPFLAEDRALTGDVERIYGLLKSGSLLSQVESALRQPTIRESEEIGR
ncbi:HAL/PAL/TAL family ammonia-lyase [Cohnella nanjingensis]|uniref:Histidine ammonia-lyase n=1 Tax=Cohnella nanjingensis TaxID=1387779 RepID=A0A7X0S0F9_9BACL|nr:aromatic amino acid ammonia-lyase [Cohnella nanjingensis]MBB6675394.1 histidine ammonia-lyase [Cohnella nanjingensis]